MLFSNYVFYKSPFSDFSELGCWGLSSGISVDLPSISPSCSIGFSNGSGTCGSCPSSAGSCGGVFSNS